MQSNMLYVKHKLKCEANEVRSNLKLIPASIGMSFTFVYQESLNYLSFKSTLKRSMKLKSFCALKLKEMVDLL